MAENDTADATFAFVDLAGFVVLTEICARPASGSPGRAPHRPCPPGGPAGRLHCQDHR